MAPKTQSQYATQHQPTVRAFNKYM